MSVAASLTYGNSLTDSHHTNFGAQGDHTDHAETYACRALWCAVIENAAKAVANPKKHATGESRVEARRTRAWFRSADFVTVCDLAGIDAGYIRSGVNRLIEDNGGDPV
jgi:hypothetical protein